MSDLYLPSINDVPALAVRRTTMNGKPVFEVDVKSVMNFKSDFGHKLLCDCLTFSLGSACVFNCCFCYVASIVRKHPQIKRLLARLAARGLSFHDVVVRRRNALDILREELTVNLPAWADPNAKLVAFTSTLVDGAGNMELVRETVEACLIIFGLTNWDVRILSKSALIKNLAEMLPQRFQHRVIMGVSTGTLDDKLAASFEQGTALVSQRLKALHWLQDNGFRTFGMICPSLPQDDYANFAARMAEAVRVDRCEHLWGEVLNVRGDSLTATLAALEKGGFHHEAGQIRSVSGPGSRDAWEGYARQTFLAHAENIPPEKLRFLQYLSPRTRAWWADQSDKGAVLLGKAAKKMEAASFDNNDLRQTSSKTHRPA